MSGKCDCFWSLLPMISFDNNYNPRPFECWINNGQTLDGLMDGWMDKWMDGWMDDRMDGWLAGWMDGWMFQNLIVTAI